MFSYCLNNPANGCDPCGTCFHRWDFWNDCEKCGGKTICDKVDGAIEWCVNTINDVVDYVSNDDATVAQNNLKGDGFTFYKGAPIVSIDALGKNAASVGLIVLGGDILKSSDFTKTLNHEYGHFLQLQEYGLVSYVTTIATPSATANLLKRADLLPWSYYSSPWEYEADRLGRVTHSNYSVWASSVSSVYSYFSRAVALLFKW